MLLKNNREDLKALYESYPGFWPTLTHEDGGPCTQAHFDSRTEGLILRSIDPKDSRSYIEDGGPYTEGPPCP